MVPSEEFFDALPVDTSEAVKFDDSPVDEGDYELALVGAKGRIAKGSGNPVVTWEFSITDGEREGRRIWHDTPTVGRGSGMLVAVISALGYDFDEWLASVGGQITPDALNDLLGSAVKARVKVEKPNADTLAKYPNAKDRNKIAKFYA